MRISDWSSDVCSSDLRHPVGRQQHQQKQDREQRIEDNGQHNVQQRNPLHRTAGDRRIGVAGLDVRARLSKSVDRALRGTACKAVARFGQSIDEHCLPDKLTRSEEHTSELKSLMRTSYAVFCLKKKTNYTQVKQT